MNRVCINFIHLEKQTFNPTFRWKNIRSFMKVSKMYKMRAALIIWHCALESTIKPDKSDLCSIFRIYLNRVTRLECLRERKLSIYNC